MSTSDQVETVEQIVLGIAQRVFTAIQQKNVNSLGEFLASDFVHRTPDGSESGKEEFLLGIGDMPLEIRSIRGENQKVSVFGDVAVMTGVQRAEWRQEDAAEGVSSVAFTDVFALRGKQWLMVLAYGVELES